MNTAPFATLAEVLSSIRDAWRLKCLGLYSRCHEDCLYRVEDWKEWVARIVSGSTLGPYGSGVH